VKSCARRGTTIRRTISCRELKKSPTEQRGRTRKKDWQPIKTNRPRIKLPLTSQDATGKVVASRWIRRHCRTGEVYLLSIRVLGHAARGRRKTGKGESAKKWTKRYEHRKSRRRTGGKSLAQALSLRYGITDQQGNTHGGRVP